MEATTKLKQPPKQQATRMPEKDAPVLSHSYSKMINTAKGRTRLARDCGKVVNAIFGFTEKHKLSPSLERRLKNCANDLWDIEWEEDVKSGAYERSEFGKMSRRASQDHKEGKIYSLEETLEILNKRLR